MAPKEYKMDTVKHHARSLLKLKVLFVMNQYGCDPEKGGLHCSNDTEGVGGQDFYDFIDPVVAASGKVLFNLVNNLRAQGLDHDTSLQLNTFAEGWSLPKDSSSDGIRVEKEFLDNGIGYMLYSFSKFLRLETSDDMLYQFPQEFLSLGSRSGQSVNSAGGDTKNNPYVLTFMQPLLDAAESIPQDQRQSMTHTFDVVKDFALWELCQACKGDQKGNDLFAAMLADNYDLVIVGPDVTTEHNTKIAHFQRAVSPQLSNRVRASCARN